VPEKKHLKKWISGMHQDLSGAMGRQLTFYQQKLDDLHSRLKSPVQIMARFRQTLTSHCLRIRQALKRRIFHDREKLLWITRALPGAVPEVRALGKQVLDLNSRLDLTMQLQMAGRRNQVRQTAAALSALNPVSVLNRGYSIARTVPDQTVILDAGMVKIQDSIEIILARGRILSRVEKTIHGKDHI
jgi:exodeoxyribonuclease VII large subunit